MLCLSFELMDITNIYNNSNQNVDILRVFIFTIFLLIFSLKKKKQTNNPITCSHNNSMMNTVAVVASFV